MSKSTKDKAHSSPKESSQVMPDFSNQAPVSYPQQYANPQSDEIDLFKVFELIGTAFASIKQSIGNALRFVLTIVLQLLLLVKKNLVLLLSLFVVGVLIGYFIEQRKPKTYVSEMVVEPVKTAVRQLYTNIDELNYLIEEEKFDQLATKLVISQKEAESIKEIEIRPVLSESRLLSMYVSYVKQLGLSEETGITPVSFEEYKDKLVKYDNKQHIILFESEIPTLAKKCEDILLDVFSRNGYIKQLKELNQTNLKDKERLLQKQLIFIYKISL